MSRFMVYRRCTWGFKDVQGVCINGPFRVLSLGLTQGFGLLKARRAHLILEVVTWLQDLGFAAVWIIVMQ